MNEKEPFEKLWKRMEPMGSNDLIRKIIVKEGFGERPKDDSTLEIFYCGYFDGQNTPFTSNKSFIPWVILFCLIIACFKYAIS